MSKVIVYHAKCHDGITALWAALQSDEWADAEIYDGFHGTPPDLARLRGKDVLIVDFSWERLYMYALAVVCKRVTVIDHHATAAADLEGFQNECVDRDLDVGLVLDMERSGAGLTWNTFHGPSTRPALIDYVEDKPGIPPAPQHMANLIRTIQQKKIKALLVANFTSPTIPQSVADKAGTKMVVLPASVGGEKGIDGYADLFDVIVGRPAEVLK